MKITFYERNAIQYFPQIQKEMKRLEKIFSLYDEKSRIRILNHNGILYNPSKEMLEVLEIAQKISKYSQGVFDISIASILKKYYKEKNHIPIVDYRLIKFSKEKIYFKKKGMSITLNALVQGYFADYFYTYLKNLGIKNALINTGEYKALGKDINSKHWKVHIKGTQSSIDLPDNNALAISTIKNSNNTQHSEKKIVIIIGPSACIADALATTLSIKNNTKLDKIFTDYSSLIKKL